MSLPPRRLNRANWVALRTLRQVPKVVGKTERGDPIFEVRNVRMLLPSPATHFSRLVTCMNCAREVAGLPVLSAADLNHAPGPFLCADCVAALRALSGDGVPAAGRVDVSRSERPAKEELVHRLDDLDRRFAAAAAEENARAEALETRLRELEAGVEEAVTAKDAESPTLREAIEDRIRALDDERESQRAEVQARLREGLADVRAAAAVPADIVDRLQALQKQGRQNQDELSELHELHAALDAGLGALRSEIGDVRTGVKRVADGQADIDDRLETYVRASLTPDEATTGRRPGRKGAEADRMTAVAAAIEDLMREQRQLKQELASLAERSDATAAAASRAAGQVSALSPLRSELKLLRQEIAEQNEALDTLRKTVEAQRRSGPTRTPAGKRAPAKKKD